MVYRKVDEVNNGPGRARGTSEEREDEEPSEEDDGDVGGPHARVLEPGGVLVQIRWWLCLHCILQAMVAAPRNCTTSG